MIILVSPLAMLILKNMDSKRQHFVYQVWHGMVVYYIISVIKLCIYRHVYKQTSLCIFSNSRLEYIILVSNPIRSCIVF